jgi:antirestriction protein
MYTLEPKIYVACLAAHNSGIHHGRWIDATLDADDIQDEINAMLAESPCPGAEEWAIHDYEEFGELTIEECTSIESIVSFVMFIEKHEELGAAVLQYCDHDIDSATSMLEDNYHGEWENELDFATNLFDEIYAYSIPEPARFYINYESFRYDIFIDSYYSVELRGKTHVFSC